ncbi:heterokaryon incompatibility protein-domain-containing protein [Xylaria palmicola]|nr:heterokaryon incompatibility protein-domain-containing protein [Xylaria palmicola]
MTESAIIRVDGLTAQPRFVNALPSFSSAQLYDSLPVDQGCIRVLDLEPRRLFARLPGQPVEPPLRGTLRVVSLEDCPNFVALLYVWGSKADPPDVLLCNSCEIKITSNCKDALQAMRRSQGPVTIWVDAICINQGDNADKASQIPNMQDIYTWAQMVYVWLGLGNEHTDSVMKVLKLASRRCICLTGNRIQHADCKLPGRRGPEDPWTLCIQDLKDCLAYMKLALPFRGYARMVLGLVRLLSCKPERRSPKYLESLLSRPWISRAWTFQELILARDITLMCGEQSISWDRFVRGMWYVAYRYHHGEPNNTLNLDPPGTSYFREWYAMITLWMNVRRKTTWGTRRMRCEHAGGATMNNHQSPILLAPVDCNIHARAFVLCLPLSFPGIIVIKGSRVLVIGLLLLLPIGTLSIPLIVINQPIFGTGYTLTIVLLTTLFPLIVFNLVDLVAKVAGRLVRVTFDVRKKMEVDAVDELIHIVPQVTKYRSATDPRDRVYATHGILRSFNIPLSEVDYTKSEGQVYSEFFSDLLRSSPRYLVFIIDAGLPDDASIPSWVPNWKTALGRSWTPSNIYSSSRSELEAAIGSPHVELAGKTLRVRGMVACRVGFVTERFGIIERGQPEDLALNLERPVATLCQLIHRARDLSFNPAYETIIKSILQTINALKPASEQFDGHNTFSELYEKIRGCLHQVEDAQVDYMAVSRKVLQRHICPRKYPALADFFNKFAKRVLFDTLVGTSTGYLGYGPPGMRAGNLVVIVAGVPVPMILGEAEISGTYRVMGSAFVLGLMEREDWQSSSLTEFTLV